MKQFTLLFTLVIIIGCLLGYVTCSSSTIVTAQFGEEYTTSHFDTLFVYHNYSNNGCSMQVSLNVTSSFDNVATFKMINYNPDSFTHLMPYRNYHALGSLAFQMKESKQVNVLFSFICPSGILNVVPSTMDIFITENKFSFLNPTNSELFIASGSIGYMANTNHTDLLLALGGIYSLIEITDNRPAIFYGPQQFYHTEHGNHDFTITLPNVQPSFSNYSLMIDNVNERYQNFTTLFSYALKSTNSPNLIGWTTRNNIIDGNFKNIYGNSIDILPNSIKCISSNGKETEESIPTYFEDSLLCNSSPSSSFVAAIASMKATELKVGESFSTGSITSSITYKFTVPMNKTLIMSDIALDDSLVMGYIVFNVDSSSTIIASISALGGTKDKSFTNSLTESTVVYVQFGSQKRNNPTSIKFTTYFADEKQDTSYLAFLISLGSITLAILIFIVVISILYFLIRWMLKTRSGNRLNETLPLIQ